MGQPGPPGYNSPGQPGPLGYNSPGQPGPPGYNSPGQPVSPFNPEQSRINFIPVREPSRANFITNTEQSRTNFIPNRTVTSDLFIPSSTFSSSSAGPPVPNPEQELQEVTKRLQDKQSRVESPTEQFIRDIVQSSSVNPPPAQAPSNLNTFQRSVNTQQSSGYPTNQPPSNSTPSDYFNTGKNRAFQNYSSSVQSYLPQSLPSTFRPGGVVHHRPANPPQSMQSGNQSFQTNSLVPESRKNANSSGVPYYQPNQTVSHR